jgi:hypothetical protein
MKVGWLTTAEEKWETRKDVDDDDPRKGRTRGGPAAERERQKADAVDGTDPSKTRAIKTGHRMMMGTEA